MLLVVSSCTTDNANIEDNLSETELKIVSIEAKSIELEILNLINKHRESKGLNTLNNMPIIKSVAYSHTDYMADKDVVSHDNFFIRSNYLKSNIGAKQVSENVAYGYTSAESVVNAWIRSEGHKANLEGDYTNFDISAEKSLDGNWYYTNIFIKK